MLKSKFLFAMILLVGTSFGWKKMDGFDTLRAGAKVAAPQGVFDSIDVGNSFFSYDTGSGPCTLTTELGDVYFYSGTYKDSIGVLRWSKIGNVYNVNITGIQLACSTSTDYGNILVRNWIPGMPFNGGNGSYIPIAVPQHNCSASLFFNHNNSRVEIQFGKGGETVDFIPVIILENFFVSFNK
jgi:hypothetical protein